MQFRHLFLAPFVISIGIALYNHSPEAMLYGFLATILFVVVAAYNVTTSAW